MSNVTSRTVRLSDAAPAGQQTRAAPHLFLVLECQRPLAGGARHALDDIDEIVLGRGAAREATRDAAARRLSVKVPDPLMSSMHARIRRDASGGFTIEDAGSTNGTNVDGERVTKASLASGALVDLGTTLFVVHDALPTPASAPADADSSTLAGRTHGLSTLVPDYAGALWKLAEIAFSDLFVLLLGESGTGKEVLARGIHALSGRKGSFVPVNCGAIPESLVESQLFGHTKGAFSGAQRDEPGFVRASDGGTLLLDEIGDLPRTSQAALLRVLQEREVTSVGATRAIKVDLRVVAATHRRVDTLANSDGFRSDLYARLAGYTHGLLPLRARKEDLGLLIADILPRVAGDRAPGLRLELDLARALFHHDWPLNIRELQHALAAAVVFAKDGLVCLANAPDAVRRAVPGEGVESAAAVPSLSKQDAAVKAELLAALDTHRGNVSEVARLMKRTRMQVHRWMRRFGIDPATYRT